MNCFFLLCCVVSVCLYLVFFCCVLFGVVLLVFGGFVLV